MLAVGVAAIACSFVLDVATGPALLPVGDVARAVLRLSSDATIDAIVWSLRLPIAGMAVVVGAALGLTGAIMQTILNNPLASSYTLGISAGAGFGAALAIATGASLPIGQAQAVPMAAFLFAGVACAGVYGIGQLKGATPEMLVLGGITFLFLFQALLSLVQFTVSPEALQQIVFWLFGSLQKATWTKLSIVTAALVASLPILLSLAWPLTTLRFGDERATALGISVKSLRLRALLLVSLLTGTAVAFVGTIGFIGLVAPHVARMLVGEDQRFLLPGAAISGALLLSLASVASKLVMPGTVFPIGILTALIGVPFFLLLVLRPGRTFW